MKDLLEPESRTTGVTGSVERTLQLIQILATEGRAMTLAQLSKRLALPKSTAHRLCARLVDQGFLAREIDERYFTVGLAMHRLAFNTLTHGTYSGLRHNVLSDLVDEIGETCNFTTLDGASVLYLDRVEAARPWRLTLSVGVHVPLHCTASGKLFLSHMKESDRETLLGKLELKAITRNSITERARLLEAISTVKQQGYATDEEEFVIGLIAVAVPVMDAEGKVRAAIAMHCPATHIDYKLAMTKLPFLNKAAEKMSQLLEI